MANKDQFTEYANKKIIQEFKDKFEGMTESEKEGQFEDFKSTNYAIVFSKMAKIWAESLVEDMESTMYEHVIANRSEIGEFHARQEQKWGKGFIASEAMYIAVQEIGENYVRYILEERSNELEPIQNTFDALKLIHARSCQQYLEIFHLNRLGFADGAFVRWRSMYELMIMADFIKQQGEDVARKFIEAADTNVRYDWAKQRNVSWIPKKNI